MIRQNESPRIRRRPQPTGHRVTSRENVWILGCLAATFAVAACPVVLAQGNPQEDARAQTVGPIAVDSLPIGQESRNAINDCLRSGEYTRAEELLLAEADGQPNSYPLLAALGRTFFLMANT